MAYRVLAGTRVRNRRLDLGVSQVDLARQINISGSYLNLIEHNRRRIGGALLAELAQVLKIDVALLEDGTTEAVLGPLNEAAAAFPQVRIEEAKAESLVERFPGWASLITAQAARIAQLEERTRTLSDRLAHDTQIANSLHEVISTATAIRSTASILAETPDLDSDWQSRFHSNIDTDSERLAESSKALLGFLDMEVETGSGALATPIEAAEAAMAGRGYYIPEAETQTLPDMPDVDDATRGVIQGWAVRAGLDAQRLPLVPFTQAARAVAYDPARLAAWFQVPLEVVLRRLAHLPPQEDHPAMGVAECDAAGVVTYQKPVLDFRLARAGAACPLWPLYQALTQPGRAVRRVVQMPGVARTSFECFAIAAPVGDVVFGAEQRIAATMLVRPAKEGAETPGIVGPGCRVCSIERCESRRHPSII